MKFTEGQVLRTMSVKDMKEKKLCAEYFGFAGKTVVVAHDQEVESMSRAIWVIPVGGSFMARIWIRLFDFNEVIL